MHFSLPRDVTQRQEGHLLSPPCCPYSGRGLCRAGAPGRESWGPPRIRPATLLCPHRQSSLLLSPSPCLSFPLLLPPPLFLPPRRRLWRPGGSRPRLSDPEPAGGEPTPPRRKAGRQAALRVNLVLLLARRWDDGTVASPVARCHSNRTSLPLPSP